MAIQDLNALIDQVVAPQTGGPKVKGPALNNLLRNLAAEIGFNSYSKDDDALFAFQVGTSYNPSHFHLVTLTVKQLRQLVYDADTQFGGYSTVSITTDEAAGHRHTVVVTYDPQKHAVQVLRVENEDGAEQQDHTAYPIVGDAKYAKLEGGNIFVGEQVIDGGDGGKTYGTYEANRVGLKNDSSQYVELTPSSLAFFDFSAEYVVAGSIEATGSGVLTVSTTHFKVPTPYENDDAATKAYVDSRIEGGVSVNYLGFTPSLIQSALVISGNTNWSYGEFTGSLPAGSVPGMKFRATNNLNQAYVFEYLLASNDVNGSQFSWSRYSSS